MIQADVAVIGSGPGGYAAAFYAADRGQRVVLIEQDPPLGGVCLHRGCIPSKALLHATAVMREAHETSPLRGIVFDAPRIDLERLRAWKQSVVDQLAQGLSQLARARMVTMVQGYGRFVDSHTMQIESAGGPQTIHFRHAIIASGSRPAVPEALALRDERVMTSTEALQLSTIPAELLVVGGGYIGLELGLVYASLGSRVILVEALEHLLAGVDADLVRPVARMLQRRFAEVHLGTRVVQLSTAGDRIKATLHRQDQPLERTVDAVLVATGRRPHGDDLGLERTRVARNARGYVEVDQAQRTADPHILAIGDLVGGPLLAHKAAHEARVAVEAITGTASPAQPAVMPSVVFTDPEIAWCGLTEADAKAHGVAVRIVKVPWSASGRAVSLDRPDGLTKLLVEAQTERIVGVGMVGVGVGELVGEAVLAVQQGLTARELGRAIHAHPTLSETLKEAAELFYGFAPHVLSRTRASDVR